MQEQEPGARGSVVKGKGMTLGEPSLRESMDALTRQIVRQPHDRQVEVRLLLDGDRALLDEFFTGGQLGVLFLPQCPVVINIREQLRQNVEQTNVQFARELGIRQAEETAGQRRRLWIGVGGKNKRDPCRVAPHEYSKVASLSDVDEQVAMTFGHSRLQHRKDPNEPILVEVVVRHNVGFDVERGATPGS